MSSPADNVRELLRRQPVFDGHNDLPWAIRRLAGNDLDRFNLDDSGGRTHTDIMRLRAGHVGAQFWSVWVPPSLPEDRAVSMTLEQVEVVHRMIERRPDDFVLAVDADDVLVAQAEGRIACLVGAEGGHSIGTSLDNLRTLFDRGVRYLTLTHNDNVGWADSATDTPDVGGLSPFGREVVREMNRLGMIVDLAHVSVATMKSALDASVAPVIFSHSSCRALVDHPRNVPDDVLRRLRTNGGVFMVTFVPQFVSIECSEWIRELTEYMHRAGCDPEDDDAYQRAEATFTRNHPKPRATLAQVADHVEHAREVAGVDHIGIGGDYDGCPDFPIELPDVGCYPVLFEELLNRGWSADECERLAGRNATRVLREVTRTAEQNAWPGTEKHQER